ncbi:hypothetical protein DOTSEDRAFT_81965 [Dothistroma septosporum NZE10]|uniref:Uncharacterized protein n=1 Tax=Dothistroma septosporum (strain NZE10 / CBS 128990) TaxID=675120 RepID=N1PKE6_DOTSN|nr:hypothetical protein DOTSEDRAFT_81965 [Dothistroma septosporum NZE10]
MAPSKTTAVPAPQHHRPTEAPSHTAEKARAIRRRYAGVYYISRQGDLDILYVSPTKKSFRNFTNVCFSPFYQRHVTHVIFVARCLDEVRDLDTFQRRKEVEHLSYEGAKRLWRRYEQLTEDHLPEILPTLQTRVTGSMRPSVKVSRTLADGLLRLPRLNSVSIVYQCGLFGPDANSLWREAGCGLHSRANGEYRIRDDEEVWPALLILDSL